MPLIAFASIATVSWLVARWAWVDFWITFAIFIPDSGGCRKVRWSRAGMGKRGGARVIYFVSLPSGEIWLLLVYVKAVRDNIPGHILKSIRKEIENG